MSAKPDMRAKIKAAMALRAKEGVKCGICRLPAEALTAVREARSGADPAPFTLLAKVLREEGHVATGTQLSNHFRIHENSK